MPVGLDRFVRVMSGGLVVTDKLVEVRTGKVNATIKEVENKIKEVKLTGLACPQLDKAVADLTRDRDTALKLKGNKEKCEALEPVKERARETAKQAVDVVSQAQAAVKATDDAIKAIKALEDEATSLKKLGFDTKEMDDQFNDLVEMRVDSAKLTDIAARTKSATAIKKQADEAVTRAKALSKAAADAGATDKKKPDATQKSKIYEAALKNLYGLEIEVPNGMTNTHFDKVFDMFSKVPKDHVGKGKLNKLLYDKDPGWAGGGAYNSALKRVRMGEFGTATKTEKYKVGDTEVDANSFNVTTLHEIGHAVDDNNNVMDSHMGTAGFGKWKKEEIADVATACVTELKKTAGLSDKVKEEDLKKAATAAVKDGKTDKPNEIEQPDWDKIKKWLTDTVLVARSKPYFKATWTEVGTSAYTQDADTGGWWSYDPNERKANGVNNYQWRSPAEWFAEIYAITWLAKKPPKGVAADVAKHMWGGKSA